MKKLLFALSLLCLLAQPVSAAEFTAPEVPEEARSLMPENTESFSQGMQQLLDKARSLLRPDIDEASRVGLAIISAALTVSLVKSFSGPSVHTADFAGTAVIASVMLLSTDSLVGLAVQTLRELTEYGKLLLPVMAAALAAQGGITSSGALYAGTSVFSSFLSSLISRLFIPLVYIHLALSVAGSAFDADMLKKTKDLLKGFMVWSLKAVLTVFTTYMGITGILSGNTDAASLKAAKVTISTFVPVVGSILSDASESLLVSISLARGAAGLYGIFAVLAIYLEPFCRIGAHYLILKGTAAVSSLFSTKAMSDLIADFSSAMGLLLGMTGSVCLLQLISTVCFLKGVG